MAEAVEQRGGEFLVAEDLDPFREGQVGGDQRRAALGAVGQQIEEQFAAGAVEGDKAQLGEDEQLDALEAVVQARERFFVARSAQRQHEVGRAHERDAMATAGGFDPQRDGRVGFARADRAGQNDVLAARDPFAAG